MLTSFPKQFEGLTMMLVLNAKIHPVTGPLMTMYSRVPLSHKDKESSLKQHTLSSAFTSAWKTKTQNHINNTKTKTAQSGGR